MAGKRSIAEIVGLPDPLRGSIVLIALAVLLAPYVGGVEFGPLKVPMLPAELGNVAIFAGPVLFVISVGVLLPIWETPSQQSENVRDRISKEQRMKIDVVDQLFAGKDEVALRHDFGFKTLFEVNVLSMKGEYGYTFFDLASDREAGPLSWQNCPRRLRVQVAANDPMAIGEKGGTLPPRPALSSSADRTARWASYEHDPVYLNRQWLEMQRLLTNLAEDAVLPSELKGLLQKYLDTSVRDLHILFNVLNEGARGMPARCRSPEELKNMPTDWLWNQYMKEFDNLKPDADVVRAFIREYLDPDHAVWHS